MSIGRQESALSEISAFVDQQSRFWQVGNPPRAFFHYTSPEGLIGIVTGTAIWASDMLSLNDASEAAYPYRLIAEVLDAKHPHVSQEHIHRFKTQLTEYTFRLYAPFVVCFSEERDLLSQWRAYGNNGEGFALAFKLGFEEQRNRNYI
jgi:hypothetical protein